MDFQFLEKEDGIVMDCLLKYRLRKNLILKAKKMLKNMEQTSLLNNAEKMFFQILRNGMFQQKN